jgi:hypothetical protein
LNEHIPQIGDLVVYRRCENPWLVVSVKREGDLFSVRVFKMESGEFVTIIASWIVLGDFNIISRKDPD